MSPRFGALIAALLATALLSTACTRDKAAKETPRPPAPVIAAEALRQDVPITLQAIGTVQPYSTVAIKALVSGQVSEVRFREGQEVAAGEVLFLLDTRSMEAELRQAAAAMDKDRVLARRAREQADRYAALLRQGSLSSEQYEQSEASAQALEAQIEIDRANVDRLKLQIEYCTIKAPIDGRTGEIGVHAGNLVKAYETQLVTIDQVHPLYVEFSLPEAQLSEVRARKREGRLVVEATTGQKHKAEATAPPEQGTLSFIDSGVNTTTGTIKLKATFPNTGHTLWPGQFANVTLRLGTLKGAITVPTSAVQTGQNGQYVFVIRQDMSTEMRPVKPGPSHEDRTVVLEGLQSAELVVADGHLRVVPGAKVAIKNSPAPKAPTAPKPPTSPKPVR